MNEDTNAIQLLREYVAHHATPMECGTAYISRSFADADAEIMNRIREFLETVED
ncbi:MAG: hypothetical protein GY911_10370 [Actinomycetales bacterium]|nr:hypothetical protein [Actinomycetales bacterium]